MQCQPPFGRGHILADDRSLMRRQAVQDQMDRLSAPIHHLLEQIDEQLAIERTFIDAKPERPLSRHRRGSADRLALSRTFNHRGLTAYTPGLAMHGIGAKSRLVPEKYLRALSVRSTGNGRIGFALPLLDGLRVTLIGALQWL